MTLRTSRLLLAIAAAAVALHAHSISIRPDRDDAEYLELATRYPSSLALGTPGGGEGVLITPRWILTSAARAEALRKSAPRAVVRIGGEDYEVQEIVLKEVGLVLLRKMVRGVDPSLLYRESDESGKAVALVGHGGGDGRKRASINTIDRVEARTFALRVKPLEEASDLQGTATAGDIGGPAFIETSAGILVAGVLASLDGDWQTYTRISPLVPWIEAVILDRTKRELESMLDPDRR